MERREGSSGHLTPVEVVLVAGSDDDDDGNNNNVDEDRRSDEVEVVEAWRRGGADGWERKVEDGAPNFIVGLLSNLKP